MPQSHAQLLRQIDALRDQAERRTDPRQNAQ